MAERIQIDDLYREVYPGIIKRALKLTKGNKMLSEDWSGEAILTMMECYRRYGEIFTKEHLVKFTGRAVARRLSVCYQGEKRKKKYIRPINDVIQNSFAEFDDGIEDVQVRKDFKNIVEQIYDVRLRQFFIESFDPSTDVLNIVEQRISIKMKQKEAGEIGYGRKSTHPTDKEIGQLIGISKATSSRFRQEIKRIYEKSKFWSRCSNCIKLVDQK